MPIIRNPFRRQDENVRPTAALTGIEQKGHATPPVKPVDIKEKEPAEYKLSEINDSGVYLPPSPPPERKSFWTTTSSSRSTTSSNHRSLLAENSTNEQFNISRESFESYRRSFDISARSPMLEAGRPGPRMSLDTGHRAYTDSAARLPRASLDSRTFQPPLPPPVSVSRSSNSFTRPSNPLPTQTAEEEHSTDNFEDVDIAEKPTPVTKKRGLFSRITTMDMGDHHSERPGSGNSASEGGRSWHHLGRKRGQSGVGAELGSIAPKREGTPRVESQLRREGEVRAVVAAPQQVLKTNSQSVEMKGAEPTAQAAPGAPASDMDTSKAGAAVTAEPQAQAGAQEPSQPPQSHVEGMETLNLDDSSSPTTTQDPATTTTTTPTAVPTPAVAESAAATKDEVSGDPKAQVPTASRPQSAQAPENSSRREEV